MENCKMSPDEGGVCENGCAAATGVKLYQLVPENMSLMESYVLKTANGKLIVIDGGINGNGRDRLPYLSAGRAARDCRCGRGRIF